MPVDLANFVHSLARHVVTRAAALTPPLPLVYFGTPPRDLWRNRAVTGEAADPFTVLRPGPGPGLDGSDPLPRCSIQVMTEGTNPDATLQRAQVVFETLCGDDAKAHIAARMLTIDGYTADADAPDGHWLIVSIDHEQRPGLLTPTPEEREQGSFNILVGFVKRD
jgi:hypothetical protein